MPLEVTDITTHTKPTPPTPPFPLGLLEAHAHTALMGYLPIIRQCLAGFLWWTTGGLGGRRRRRRRTNSRPHALHPDGHTTVAVALKRPDTGHVSPEIFAVFRIFVVGWRR